MDWHAWHAEYEAPDSSLGRRLRVVQDKIRAALDGCPPGPLRIISLCAGQGRDLLQVLAEHPRAADVTARLVELDARNSQVAEQMSKAAGLHQVEVVTADAALTDRYQGMAPADIVLACGLFGNITDEDIKHTIASCRQLCATGGTIIWTRGRTAPDKVPSICDWFREHDFDLQWLSEPDAGFGVGVHRYTGVSRPLTPDVRMFSFIGYNELKKTEQQD
jgi:hypothetical protein